MRQTKNQDRPYVIVYDGRLRDSATTFESAMARVKKRLSSRTRSAEVYLRGELVWPVPHDVIAAAHNQTT